MRFNQEFIDKVRETTNIVDIIGEHTQLKGSGGRFMGLCPFPNHKEKTPSFSVNEDRQLYHCFGCKKSGNVFHFIQEMQGLSFPETIEYLAKRASLALPETTQSEDLKYREAKSKKEAFYRINKLAASYYFENLKKMPTDHPCRSYLEKRGLRSDIVELFKIGASSEEWEGLTQFLINKKVPLAMAETLGLIRKKKSGGGYYDVLRGRLIFPILSQTREVIGFGGRAYIDIQPKYLNSPETPVFSKGRHVYSLQEAARHIRSEDSLIVVEGYMDNLALFQGGIYNSVATLGTALTPEHCQLFRKFTPNVIVLFDGDDAGIYAAERSLPLLLAADLMPRGVFLPEGMDPDDYIKKYGSEKLQEQLRDAKDLFSLVFAYWMRNYRATPSEQVALIDSAAPILAVVQSQRLKDLYALEISQALGATMDWVQKALRESRSKVAAVRPNFSTQKSELVSPKILPRESYSGERGANLAPPPEKISETSEVETIRVTGAPREEVLILSLALKNKRLFELLSAEGFESLTHPGIRLAIKEVMSIARQRPNDFDTLGALLASKLDKPQLVTAYLDFGAQDLDEQGEAKLMRDCLQKVKNRHLRGEARRLASQIDRDDLDPRQLEQIMNIHRDRLSLNKDES